MRIHLIGFTGPNGPAVGRVTSHRVRPTWRECAAQIPGFNGGGSWLGIAPESQDVPMYSLTYDTPVGEFTKTMTSAGIAAEMSRINDMVANGAAWNVRTVEKI